MNKKIALFDGCLFAYSLALVVYLLLPAEQSSQDQAILVMNQITGAFLGLVLFGMALSAALRAGKVITVAQALFHPQSEVSKSWWKTFRGLHLFFLFIVTLWVSLKMTEFSVAELTDPEGVKGALRLYSGLTHANWAILPIAIAQIVETVFIAFLATVLAVPAALILSFLSAKNIMTSPFAFGIYAVLRALLNIGRSVEPLIWALIFTVWVGIGPFAGMLALMIHSIASLAKQYSEIIEDIQLGPVEGIQSTGAGTLQVLRYAVFSQVLLPLISFTIYRWDTNVRMATIIGLVGGGGIGTLLIKYQGQAMWPEVGCIIFVIAGAVWLMDTASAYVREALR